jgi:hypothetical protein
MASKKYAPVQLTFLRAFCAAPLIFLAVFLMLEAAEAILEPTLEMTDRVVRREDFVRVEAASGFSLGFPILETGFQTRIPPV